MRSDHAIWILIIGFNICSNFFILLFYFKRKKFFGDDKKFRWSYIFIGPYFFQLLNNELHGRKNLFTRRELIGWLIVILLLVIAISFGL